jgi:hypothetical protein
VRDIKKDMKNKKLIPKGLYCYSGNYKTGRIICPYWGLDPTPGRDKQENGYCSYLGKSDWDLNEEKHDIEESISQEDGTYKTTIYTNITNHEFGCNDSLLWDQCKECDINNSMYDEITYYCDKCKHRHYIYTKVGKAHERKYQTNA